MENWEKSISPPTIALHNIFSMSQVNILIMGWRPNCLRGAVIAFFAISIYFLATRILSDLTICVINKNL